MPKPHTKDWASNTCLPTLPNAQSSAYGSTCGKECAAWARSQITGSERRFPKETTSVYGKCVVASCSRGTIDHSTNIYLLELQGHAIKNQDLLIASGAISLKGSEGMSAVDEDLAAAVCGEAHTLFCFTKATGIDTHAITIHVP